MNNQQKILLVGNNENENGIYKMELYKLHKAANVANLSGLIAHNINNYLGAVMGYSDILKSAINGNEKVQHYAEKIIEASQGIAILTQRLLEYCRSLRSEPRNTNLKDIIDNVILLYKDSKDFHVDMEIPGDLPEINVDKDQLQFAIANIFLHAQRVIPDGSKIVIKASVGQLPEIHAFKTTHDKYVDLSISYFGFELDQITSEQQLKPFQIANKTYVELDLLVVRNIIEKNMGLISINSDPSKGTTINVYLPTI